MKLKTFKRATKIAAALAFTTAAGSAMADHTLQIKLDGAATKSLFIVGDPVISSFDWVRNGFCIPQKWNGYFPRGWFNTGYVLRDGSRVKVIAFGSDNCTNGFRREMQMAVPINDGLKNVYLILY